MCPPAVRLASLGPQALGGEDAAMDAGAQALAGAELTNGLECKITCETSKARRLKTPAPASRQPWPASQGGADTSGRMRAALPAHPTRRRA